MFDLNLKLFLWSFDRGHASLRRNVGAHRQTGSKASITGNLRLGWSWLLRSLEANENESRTSHRWSSGGRVVERGSGRSYVQNTDDGITVKHWNYFHCNIQRHSVMESSTHGPSRKPWCYPEHTWTARYALFLNTLAQTRSYVNHDYPAHITADLNITCHVTQYVTLLEKMHII